MKIRKQDKKRNNKGFSLVELIVVIAIMAVLVAVLAPQFTKYVDRSRQSNDATMVSGIVTAAQVGVTDKEYKIGPDTYTITVGTSGMTVTAADPTDGSTNATQMEKAITDTCGEKATLKRTANKWTEDITITIVVSDTVTVSYNTEFANYIK